MDVMSTKYGLRPTDIDGLIVMSLARQSRNIYGDLGPRCQPCSGLGQTLKLTGANDALHTHTTQCGCEGSGIDIPRLERADRNLLWNRIGEIERQLAQAAIREAYSPRWQHMGPVVKGSRQSWMETIAWTTASGTAVANTTTETIITPNVTIPANYCADGRVLEIDMMGGYGTTATPTAIITARWGGVGGTVMAKSSTVTLTSGVGSGASMTALWRLWLLIQIRSNGASGTAHTNGYVTYHTATGATAGTVTHYGLEAPIVSGSTGGTTPATATLDLTVDTALSLTITWGTANSANSAQAHAYNLVSRN